MEVLALHTCVSEPSSQPGWGLWEAGQILSLIFSPLDFHARFADEKIWHLSKITQLVSEGWDQHFRSNGKSQSHLERVSCHLS